MLRAEINTGGHSSHTEKQDHPEVRSEMFIHPDAGCGHQADRYQHIDTKLHDQCDRPKHLSVVGFLFS